MTALTTKQALTAKQKEVDAILGKSSLSDIADVIVTTAGEVASIGEIIFKEKDMTESKKKDIQESVSELLKGVLSDISRQTNP